MAKNDFQFVGQFYREHYHWITKSGALSNLAHRRQGRWARERRLISAELGAHALRLLLAGRGGLLFTVVRRLRDQDNSTVRLFPLGCCADPRDFVDGVVDYLPVCRRHRFECTPRVALSNFGRYLLNEPGQRVLPALSVPIDVYDHPAFGGPTRCCKTVRVSSCKASNVAPRGPMSVPRFSPSITSSTTPSVELVRADSRCVAQLVQEPLQELLR